MRYIHPIQQINNILKMTPGISCSNGVTCTKANRLMMSNSVTEYIDSVQFGIYITLIVITG